MVFFLSCRSRGPLRRQYTSEDIIRVDSPFVKINTMVYKSKGIPPPTLLWLLKIQGHVTFYLIRVFVFYIKRENNTPRLIIIISLYTVEAVKEIEL